MMTSSERKDQNLLALFPGEPSSCVQQIAGAQQSRAGWHIIAGTSGGGLLCAALTAAWLFEASMRRCVE